MQNPKVSGVTVSFTREEAEWLAWVVREVLGDAYRERATAAQREVMDKILATTALLKNIDDVLIGKP